MNAFIPLEQKVTIDIVSDVVCPWCYIGEERLNKALAQTEIPVEVRFRHFQLHPDIKPGATKVDPKTYLERKYGRDMSEAIVQVEQAAESEGLVIDHEKMNGVPNTLLAHRFSWWANKHGKGIEATKALFRSYFSDGKDVEDKQTLIDLAKELGLNHEACSTFLDSEEGLKEIQEEESMYRNSGVNAVPSFIINNKYMIQGAQHPEAFIKALQQAEAEMPKSGPSCTDGVCE